ncbi:uncharacterized protein LOC105837420 isoform X6 [Monomorium pharaonis]|uniref:uncharacterized protein LOC105837420 isoform X6 n=1 Tax=Monomorium pharaonis TaxID=307658 RepID=UPI001746E795|nr:uncharacterized protein LOC105837420 isoform X6 [Monomorium pharaonis]
MDSPSPNAIVSGEVPDLYTDHIDSNISGDNATSMPRSTQTSNTSRRHIDRAVSPALLKSRLELIVQNKKQHEDADLEVDVSDIKRSPSECHLRSWSDTDDQQWCVRKNRCNSDVSWQRSHALTEAWVQSKGQQGYHSFSNFVNRTSSSNSSPPDIVDGHLPPDLIIPRIAIINASNFESNASSGYFHDDRLSNYSENKLSTYSDGRTKTLSGEAVSSEKSDEIGDKTDEEENRLSPITDRIVEKENDTNSKGDDESVLSKELYFEEDNRKFIEDECDMCKETYKNQIKAQPFTRNTFYVNSDVVPDGTNDKLTMERDIPDESYIKNKQCTEILLENQPRSQGLRRRHDKVGKNSVNSTDKINVEISDTPYKKVDMEIEPLGNQDSGSGSHVRKMCPDIHANVTRERIITVIRTAPLPRRDLFTGISLQARGLSGLYCQS